MTGRLTVALALLCGPATALPAAGATETPSAPRAAAAPAALHDFDIPSMPLPLALNRYADISGRPALFPSDLVVGRTSATVRGRYTAEAALRALLSGTGLAAERRLSGLGETFILKTVAPPPAGPRPGLTAVLHDNGYSGLVQARIWQALCGNPRTWPGDYASLLRFSLDRQGRVGDASVVDSSGDPDRDAALLRALESVMVDRPPPSALVRQPVVMAILPRQSGARSPCGAAAQAH